MKTQEELKKQLHQIDRKGYKAYKVLEGDYDFGAYRLCIDHVQGDPFATALQSKDRLEKSAEYFAGIF